VTSEVLPKHNRPESRFWGSVDSPLSLNGRRKKAGVKGNKVTKFILWIKSYMSKWRQ